MSMRNFRQMRVWVLTALVSALSLHAADPENLADWKLGEVQIGEAFTHEDLKGQVVVLEYWGVW